MGLLYDHVLGRNRKFYVKKESTSGTFAKPAGTDACKILTCSISPMTKRVDRMEAHAYRDNLEKITDKNEYSWSVEMNCTPSGTVDTPPDAAPFLEAAIGTQATNGGVSVTWTLNSSQAPATVLLYQCLNSIYAEGLYGAWVEEMVIKATGGELHKMSFNGGAMGYWATGTATLDGATPGGAKAFATHTGENGALMVNSIIQIGTDDNSSAGHTVATASGVNFTTTDNINAQSNDVAIIPFAPSETTAGSPIGGILGSITHDSFSAKITGFELSLKNNIKPFSDEAFAQNVSDFAIGRRTITGSLTMRIRKDHVVHILNRQLFTQRALTVVLGSVAGKKYTISLPYVEVGFSEASIPEAEEATIQLPFEAMGSSGNDAFSLTHH